MSSTPAYRAVESASEALYEDERLRSNLTDREANIILEWATAWLEEKAAAAKDEASAQRIVQAERPRLRAALLALNDLAQDAEEGSLAAAVVALEPILTGGNPFNRDELLSLMTMLLSAAWRLRGY